MSAHLVKTRSRRLASLAHEAEGFAKELEGGWDSETHFELARVIGEMQGLHQKIADARREQIAKEESQ